MKIHPLPGYVLINDKHLANTAGGFEVAGDDQHITGVVVTCGDSAKNDKGELVHCPVHTGDLVAFKRYFGGGTIIGNGQENRLVPFHDLIAIIEEE